MERRRWVFKLEKWRRQMASETKVEKRRWVLKEKWRRGDGLSREKSGEEEMGSEK